MFENYSTAVQKAIKKVRLKAGERIRITKDKQAYEGLLLPRAELGDPDSIVIKLDNGYNIGIKYGKGVHVEHSKKAEPKEISAEAVLELGRWKIRLKKKLQFDPKKPTIAILHTGGTIASRVDYRTGGVYPSFTTEDIVAMFPELTEMANIRSRLIRNMWSEDMRFGHYELIAQDVAKEIKAGANGVIITHGTDTLHYTAAALSFMLQNLPIPVILVGAQRSSDRPSSDAAVNLISAARFIAGSDFAGVAACSHSGSSDDECWILPGTKMRKMHSSRRDTYRPVNATAIATVSYPTGNIEWVRTDYLKRDKTRKLKLLPKMDSKVALLKIHTNMHPEIFDFYRKAGYNGVVLEGTGLGQAPMYVTDKIAQIHAKIRKNLGALCKSAVVVMTSQAFYGRVNMNVYNKGRDLQALGVIPGEDMLPETAFVKLAWALANYPRKKVPEIMRTNIAGEINPITEPETFLV